MNINVQIKSAPQHKDGETFVQLLKEIFEVAKTTERFDNVIALVSQYTENGLAVTITAGVIVVSDFSGQGILLIITHVKPV